MLNRRAFLSGTVPTALAMPLALEAQQAAETVYRIGDLAPGRRQASPALEGYPPGPSSD